MRPEPSRSKTQLTAELVERDALAAFSLRSIVCRDIVKLLSGFQQAIESVSVHDRPHSAVVSRQVDRLTLSTVNQATELVACLTRGDFHASRVPSNVHFWE